jgi:hypothetical protein
MRRVLACLLLLALLVGCSPTVPREGRIQLCPTCTLYPVAVDKPSLSRLEGVTSRGDAVGSATVAALSQEGKLFEVFNGDRVLILGVEGRHTFIEQRRGTHAGRRGWVPSDIVR